MADDRFTDPDDDDFANKYKVMANDRFTAPTDPDDDFANKYIERREMHYELNSPAINLMRRDGIFFENDKSKGRVPFQPDDLGGEFFAPPDFISGVQGEAWTVPGKGSLRDLDLAIPYLATGKKLEQPGGRPSYVWDEDQKTISEEEWAKTQAERWPDEPIADEENNYIFDGDFFNLLVNGPKDTTLTRQTRQEKTAAELGGIEADPAIDPLMAASGAYGAAWRLVAGKIIPRAVTSFAAAVAAAVTDPVVGTTMEAAENIHPLLGLPVAMAVGMYFGKKLEQPVEDFVAGLMKKAGTFNPKDLTRAVKDFNKALGPEGSSVGGSIAPDSIKDAGMDVPSPKERVGAATSLERKGSLKPFWAETKSGPRPTIVNATAGDFGILYLDVDKSVKPTKKEINNFLANLGFPGRKEIVELEGGISTRFGGFRRFRIDFDQSEGITDTKEVVRALGLTKEQRKSPTWRTDDPSEPSTVQRLDTIQDIIDAIEADPSKGLDIIQSQDLEIPKLERLLTVVNKESLVQIRIDDPNLRSSLAKGILTALNYKRRGGIGPRKKTGVSRQK